MKESEHSGRNGRRQKFCDSLRHALRRHQDVRRGPRDGLLFRRDSGRSQTVESDHAGADLRVRHGAVFDLRGLHRVRGKLGSGHGRVLDLRSFHCVRCEFRGGHESIGEHRRRDLLVLHPRHRLQSRQELQGIGRLGGSEPGGLDDRDAHRRDQIEPRGTHERGTSACHGVAVLDEAGRRQRRKVGHVLSSVCLVVVGQILQLNGCSHGLYSSYSKMTSACAGAFLRTKHSRKEIPHVAMRSLARDVARK